MHTNSTLKNILGSFFNAANFNGLGATIFSIGMGSLIGASIFMSAIILGSINKFISLQSMDDTKASQSSNAKSSHILKRAIMDPTLTAKVFMLATAYNCADALYDAYLSQDVERTQSLLMALGWWLGCVGDNALRRLDSVNFSARTSSIKTSIDFWGIITAIISNPVIFYNSTVMCFAGSMLLAPNISSLEFITGIITISIVTASLVYAGYRGVMVAKLGHDIDSINDGVTNVIGALVTVGFGALGAASGNYWVMVSQFMFGSSCIKALFETRSALKK